MEGGRRTSLVVDSGACLAHSFSGAPWVRVVPMSIEIEGRALRDGIDITADQFYLRLSEAGPLPTSSSPSPGDYLEAFRSTVEGDVVCLTIPARFSMMGRSAQIAAEMLEKEQPERHVEVIDTGTAAGGFTLVAEAAAEACASGLGLEAVAAHARAVAATARVIASLDTMRFLVRSGRIPALAGIGSDLLHVRPVFAFTGGDVHRLALVRGTKKALRTVAELLAAQMPVELRVRLAVFGGAASEAIPALTENLRELLGDRPIETLKLTPVIALHTGPGLVGAAAVADLPLPS